MKLLGQFHEPQIRFNVSLVTDKPSKKNERITTASVYRNTNSLLAAGFLDEHEEKIYEMSVKGYIAENICNYLLYYEETPGREKKALEKRIEKFESNRYWYMITGSLKWHAKRNADLSSIRIDWRYIFLTAALWYSERQEQGEEIEDEKIEWFLQRANDFFLELDEENWYEQQSKITDDRVKA